MKKVALGVMLAGSLVIVGCEKTDKSTPFETIKAEQIVREYDLSYELKAEAKENKVKVQLALENRNDIPAPLLIKDSRLFKVEVKDSEGTVLETRYISENERKELLKKEKVEWGIELELNMDKEIVIEAEVLLKSNKYNKFSIKDKEKRVYVTVKTKTLDVEAIKFAPSENALYTYLNENDEEIQEEFLFFNGKKVQSFSKENGVKIFSEEADGIYVLNSKDSVGDVDGTEFVDKEGMALMIPYPIEKNKEWEIGDIKYKISDTNVRVMTEMGLFSNSVEVTEIKGEEKRYYYYDEKVGLIKVKKSRKYLPSKTELEISKIETGNYGENKEDPLEEASKVIKE